MGAGPLPLPRLSPAAASAIDAVERGARSADCSMRLSVEVADRCRQVGIRCRQVGHRCYGVVAMRDGRCMPHASSRAPSTSCLSMAEVDSMPQKLLPTQLAHRHRLDHTLSSLSSLPLPFSLLLSLLFFFCLFSSTEKNPILRGFAPQHGRTRSVECWLLNRTPRGSGRSTQTGGHSVQTGSHSLL